MPICIHVLQWMPVPFKVTCVARKLHFVYRVNKLHVITRVDTNLMIIRCLLVFVSITTTLVLVLLVTTTPTCTLASIFNGFLNLYNILARGIICPGEKDRANTRLAQALVGTTRISVDICEILTVQRPVMSKRKRFKN